MSLLSDHSWRSKYDSDSGSLIDSFYNRALACAVRYDRSTGYFSAGVLTLAARGVEGLVRNGGRMRLVVGCTLGEEEVEAIQRGESLKEVVGHHLGQMPLQPDSEEQADSLELLAWMVAQGYLEVKVAVPCTPDRKPYPTASLFHEKAGILEDKTGDRLAFNGSVNETAAGWGSNWESFHVFTDWDRGREHVEAEEASFSRLWADQAKQCLVIDVPTAAREQLLRHLPQDDQLPRRLKAEQLEIERPVSAAPEEPADLTDQRRLVWGLIQHGPSLPGGGERVGEATSIVVPWPHQVRAFDRLWRRWPPRLLIADEVGLGKTIEAGLMLRQAWLSGRARRILILAPKAVLKQWQIELREKFNLNWPIYDGQKLHWYPARALKGSVERRVSRENWHREACVLASSQLMRRADRATELVERAEPWDLVVLDEAHHARRKGAGGSRDRGPNQLLGLMQALTQRTGGLVLMTATPMQVDPIEVWDLLALLGLPGAWTGEAFQEFFEIIGKANPSHEEFERLARLFRASEAVFGQATREEAQRCLENSSSLAARRVVDALRDEAQITRRHLPGAERRAALKLMRRHSPVGKLISRHTRELLRAYYKAGKISTPIAERRVEDRFIDLSSAERAVYDQVEDYISTTYDQASHAERNAVGFVMTIYRRRLASSFAALRSTLERRLAALDTAGPIELEEDDLPDDDLTDDLLDLEDAAQLSHSALVAEERETIRALLTAAKALPIDTKAQRLAGRLAELKALGYQQVMVFTQFTDTMDFLREQLTERLQLPVLCFSGRGGEQRGRDGRWHLISREETKKRFREGAAEVLLCTDAGAEGLNFQFCGALINYDLPWNPMRVEQRIGRIDRLGQKFPEIQITNLHYADTIETIIYLRLKERIGFFKRVVGKLQPILSTLPVAFRAVAFAVPADREHQKERILSQLEVEIRQAEEQGFDLDEITAADLQEPRRAEPLYDLPSLDLVLRRPDLLPPGVEAQPLRPNEYAYAMPGMNEQLRVTTDPDFFDQHPESSELWSPGSPLFPRLDDPVSRDEVTASQKRLRDLLSK